MDLESKAQIAEIEGQIAELDRSIDDLNSETSLNRIGSEIERLTCEKRQVESRASMKCIIESRSAADSEIKTDASPPRRSRGCL